MAKQGTNPFDEPIVNDHTPAPLWANCCGDCEGCADKYNDCALRMALAQELAER